MNQRIVAHTAGDKRSVLLIDTFHQNFLYGMKMSCGYLAGNFLDLGKKTVKTVFYNIRRDLVFHGSCRCSGSSGILEGKRAVVTNAADHIQCFQKIFFGLTRETNDNICCQRNIRHFCADSVYQVKILLFGITAVHQF